jgi:hypothetical protein
VITLIYQNFAYSYVIFSNIKLFRATNVANLVDWRQEALS